MADKPFFVYFAPGATHAPHQVPPEWSDKYKGQFDDGWDALRERILARQQELGVVPADAKLTARPAEIPAWDDMPDALKPVLARQMEVYAGFLEHTDHHIGRLIDALADLEVLENTLVYYIIGDNGASAEGTPNGTFNEMMTLNGVTTIETPEFLASKIDLFGTPEAYNHYAVGWAHAMDTPYQWTKQVASHWGGTRNGTIVSWPGGIAARGEVRNQFSHVIDVAATVLDAAGLPEPTFVHGVQQVPLQGRSMRPSFDDAAAATGVPRHAVLRDVREPRHLPPGLDGGDAAQHAWVMAPPPPIDDDTWELYGPDDWTQAHDLAAEQPERLAYLQRLFLIEATKNNVLPLDDRRVERFNSDLAGRPTLIRGNTQLLFGGMGRLSENAVLNIKNKSHAVTAQVVVAEGTVASGVLSRKAGRSGAGRSTRRTAARPTATTCLASSASRSMATPPSLRASTRCAWSSPTTAGASRRGAGSRCTSMGPRSGHGRVEMTEPMAFSGDETTDVGFDSATPVSDD